MRALHIFGLSMLILGLACAGGKDGECEAGAAKEDGGCASAGDADTDADTDTDTDTDVAPRVLSFTADRSTLQTGEEVTFSAIVTDPQGIADLIGGTLQTEDGLTYASFATSGDEGAYQLAISWDDVLRLSDVADFTSSTDLTFMAVFYDVAGHSTQASTTLGLACPADSLDYCGGTACTNLADDTANCGSCGNDCVARDTVGGSDHACDGATCTHTVASACSLTLDAEDCNAYCAPHNCIATLVYGSVDATCSNEPVEVDCYYPAADFYYAKCACRESY